MKRLFRQFSFPGGIVVGDGESETGPLAAAWHSNKFLNANGGLLLEDLRLPNFRDYEVAMPRPGCGRRPRPRACWAHTCATR